MAGTGAFEKSAYRCVYVHGVIVHMKIPCYTSSSLRHTKEDSHFKCSSPRAQGFPARSCACIGSPSSFRVPGKFVNQ